MYIWRSQVKHTHTKKQNNKFKQQVFNLISYIFIVKCHLSTLQHLDIQRNNMIKKLKQTIYKVDKCMKPSVLKICSHFKTRVV